MLGAVLPFVAQWAAERPWIPFQGPLRLLASFDQSWLVWGRPLVGVAAGLAFAAWVVFDSPILEVGPDRITVRRRGEVQRIIDRDKVASVHPKGSNTVIETDSGRTLFEGEVEGGTARIRRAFLEHGYPWEGPEE